MQIKTFFSSGFFQGRLPEQGDVLHRRHFFCRRHSGRDSHLQEMHSGIAQGEDQNYLHTSSKVLDSSQPGKI